jgi:phosphohistidine phosphatase SixA
MMPGAGAPNVAVAQGSARLNGAALADALRAGRYVIVVRHGATDNARPDAAMVNLADCGTQRPLSAAGIAQAKQVEQAVSALRLPIGEVRYSPYCRTRTTAQLEFGTTGQPDQDLVAADYHGVRRVTQDAAVLTLINTVPRAGTDTVLVTHQNTIQNATGIPSPPEGGTQIYRPQPAGRPLLIAELGPADWTTLTPH